MFNTTTIEKLKAKAIELLDLRRITLRKNEGEHLAAAAAPPPPLLTITNFSNPDIQLDASQNLIAVIDVNDEKPVFAPHPKNSIIREKDFKKINIAENILGASFSPFLDFILAFHCTDYFVKIAGINSQLKKESILQSPIKVFLNLSIRFIHIELKGTKKFTHTSYMSV
jgi:hypothetical protein